MTILLPIPKAFLEHGYASTTKTRIEQVDALQTRGEKPRGGEADEEDENTTDDRRIEKNLEGRGPGPQAEDGLEGVVRVGEGDEVPQDREDSGRVLVTEKAGEIDQGKQDGRRVQEHIRRGGGEVGDKDPDAVRRYERGED